MFKKILRTGALGALIVAQPVMAGQGILGNIPIIKEVEKLIRTIGDIIKGLSPKNAEEATPNGTCQLRSDADAVVAGQAFGKADSQAQDGELICNGAKLDGLKEHETAQVLSAYRRKELAGSLSAEGGEDIVEIKTKGGKRRFVKYRWSAQQTGTAAIPVQYFTGVQAPPAQGNTLPERSYRAVNVRTRLNLRAGPSTKTAITGKYVRNNIVRVQLVISGSKTSKCRSGRWAMLFANGAGIGYVCENFLMAAPEGISDRDISAFQKPDRGRVIQERNSTIDRQITRVKAPVRRLSSSKPQKTAERANKKKTGKSSEWASYSGAYARADIGE